MAYVTVGDLHRTFQLRRGRPVTASAAHDVLKAASSPSLNNRYDVFLSHCYMDRELVAEIVVYLQDAGLTVYVDWLEDPQLDRSRISPRTADVLRRRMRQCRNLYFAVTDSSSNSRWMPWELGYFDGFRPAGVFILPIVSNSISRFVGQEYLGLYPQVEKGPGTRLQIPRGQERVDAVAYARTVA